MAQQQDLSRALSEFSIAVARQQGERFRRAILFGSHARGTARVDSDVDVAIILSDRAQWAADQAGQFCAAVKALPIFRSEGR